MGIPSSFLLTLSKTQPILNIIPRARKNQTERKKEDLLKSLGK